MAERCIAVDREHRCMAVRVDRERRIARGCGRDRWHPGRCRFSKIVVPITFPIGRRLRDASAGIPVKDAGL